MGKVSTLLAPRQVRTRSAEKEALKSAYRSSVNRFKPKKDKTGSGGKKQLGARGARVLVLDYRGRKTWRNEDAQIPVD